MPPRTNPDSFDTDDNENNYNAPITTVIDVASLSIHPTTTTTTTTTSAPPLPVIPPIPTQPNQYDSFFQLWSNNIQRYVTSYLIPTYIDTIVSEQTVSTYKSSIQAVLTATQVLADAEKVLQELQQQQKNAPSTPNIEQMIHDAQTVVTNAQINVQSTTTTCQQLAIETILQPLEDEGKNGFLSPSFTNSIDESIFLLYIVLQQNNIRSLVSWCTSNETYAKQFIDFLTRQYTTSTFSTSSSPSSSSSPLFTLQSMMIGGGGPTNQQYGRAVQIYYDIELWKKEKYATKKSTSNIIDTITDSDKELEDALFQRLQLAIALEHAEPIAYFGTPSQHVDPLKRYIHYYDAYYNNELDDHFIQFNIWELRQIVNSDATDEELVWGRQSLMSYRPDIIIPNNNPLWMYCLIVKTDVNYATPDWYKSPRSYDQILSGGGKCGPRAWYGRFICKTFGIPTWGCKQPGHAAMVRWTNKDWNNPASTSHWDVCLGGGLWKSWWNDQCGLDFLLETQARSVCCTEDVFYNKVYKLQFLSQYYYKEKNNVIRMNGQYDVNSPWYTLSMIQRQHLVQVNKGICHLMFPPLKGCGDTNNYQLHRKLSQDMISIREAIQYNHLHSNNKIDTAAYSKSTTIIIPASTCINPDKSKIMFMSSFLGGQQLFVKDDGGIVYEMDGTKFLNTINAAATTTAYNVTCYVATAHRSEQPIQLFVNNTNTYTIPMPYTMGLWDNTEPIRIDFQNLNETTSLSTVTFKIQRPKQNFGFAIKSIQFNPITM